MRGVRRHVVENPIAVLFRSYLRAAAHVGHYLRSQGHVTRGAGAVTRFGHGHPVADAAADALIKGAHRLWKFIQKAFTFSACTVQLLLLAARLFVETLEALRHVS